MHLPGSQPLQRHSLQTDHWLTLHCSSLPLTHLLLLLAVLLLLLLSPDVFRTRSSCWGRDLSVALTAMRFELQALPGSLSPAPLSSAPTPPTLTTTAVSGGGEGGGGGGGGESGESGIRCRGIGGMVTNQGCRQGCRPGCC